MGSTQAWRGRNQRMSLAARNWYGWVRGYLTAGNDIVSPSFISFNSVREKIILPALFENTGFDGPIDSAERKLRQAAGSG